MSSNAQVQTSSLAMIDDVALAIMDACVIIPVLKYTADVSNDCYTHVSCHHLWGAGAAPAVDTMMKDPYANYVVQRVLDLAQEDQVRGCTTSTREGAVAMAEQAVQGRQGREIGQEGQRAACAHDVDTALWLYVLFCCGAVLACAHDVDTALWLYVVFCCGAVLACAHDMDTALWLYVLFCCGAVLARRMVTLGLNGRCSSV